MKYGLSAKEIESIKSVFKKSSQVKRVFIFGSRAKNTFKKASDIDLAVELENDSDEVLAKLKIDLDDLPIIHEVNLIDIKEMSGSFKEEYERTKQVFYLRNL